MATAEILRLPPKLLATFTDTSNFYGVTPLSYLKLAYATCEEDELPGGYRKERSKTKLRDLT